eukprot:TRINITY_DN910_c0_g1_i6.p1 TRINITY_DN910_c0_g1~~TRINITY_DN910_c0_g1_i6.p1  ORF type:complete len:2849 (-),score=805.55 TRINITY_DN910_c0_g1_i6:52-8598(-)
MEVHGIFYDEPWELQNNGISQTVFASDVSVSIGNIDVVTANIKQVRLNALDVLTTSATAQLINKDTGLTVNSLLNGTKTIAVTQGFTNFTDLTILAPPIGNYNLTFSSGTLVSTYVLFTVVEGKPYKINIESGSLVTTLSAAPALIPPVVVSVRDPGNNKVTNITNYNDYPSSLDPKVHVQLNTSLYGFPGVNSIAMNYNGGVATFDQMKIMQPKVGTYGLIFYAAGLTFNATAVVKIDQGPPVSLIIESGKVTGPTPADHVVQSETLLPPVKIGTLDAGSNLTPLGKDTVITVESDKGSLAGTTSYTITADGTVVMDQIKIVRPQAGLYTLTYKSGTLISTTSTANITIGLPTHMHVLPEDRNQVYKSDYVVKLNPIVIQSLDSGTNVVGTKDTVQRNVTVLMSNGTVVLNGSLYETMTNGNATFAQLSLLSPPTADYVLQFSAPGLGFIVQNVHIDIGPGKSLEAIPQHRTRASIEIVDFSYILVRVLDAGGSYVGTEPAPSRQITASISGGAALGGTLIVSTQALVSATANFTHINVTAPPEGNYTVSFSTPGLLSGSMTLIIHPGKAVRFRVKPGQTYVYKSQVTTSFDPLAIQALDASGTFVRDFQLSESGVLNVTASIANTSFAGSVTFGINGQDLTNGEFTYNTGQITFTRPPTGDYILRFNMPGLIGVEQTIRIIIGDASQLQILEPANLVASVDSAAASVLPGIYIRALDPGSNWATNDPSARTITASSNTVTIGGNNQETMRNGTLSMNGTALLFPVVKDHIVVFSSPGLTPKSITVTVNSGLAYFLDLFNASVPTVDSKFESSLPAYNLISRDAGGNFTIRDENKRITPRLIDNQGKDVTAEYLIVKTADFTGVGNAKFSSQNNNGLVMKNPPQGTYQLSFTAPGLISVNTSIIVVPGPVVRLGSPNTTHTYRSQAVVNIDAILIQLADAGFNPNAGDPATLNSIQVNVVGNNQTITNVGDKTQINGALVFNKLQLPTPLAVTHILNFTAPGLVGLQIRVNIIMGDPYRVTPIAATISKKTQSAMDLGTINVQIRDIGTNPLYASDTTTRVGNVTILGGPQFTQDSVTQITISSGQGSFSNLKLKAPVPGNYTLRFCAANVTCDTFPVEVLSGDPVSLKVRSGLSKTVQSSKIQLKDSIVIEGLDVSGTFTPLPVTGSAVIRARSNDTGLRFSYTPGTMANGVARLSINMTDSLVGSHLIEFYVDDSSMANTTYAFEVTPGVPVRLTVIGFNTAKDFPSDYTVFLNTINIYVLDRGGNTVGPLDNTQRPISVLQNAAFYNSSSLQATSSNGFAQFPQPQLRSPPFNTSTPFTIQTNGLESFTLLVRVTIGPPRKIRVTSPSQIEVASNITSRIADIQLRLVDAGENNVGATDSGNSRTLSASVPGSTTDGTTSCVTVNGACTIANMLVRSPIVKLHHILFQSANMESSYLPLNVTSGLPVYLDASGSQVSIPSVQQTVLHPITIRTLDAGRNFTLRETGTISVEAFLVTGEQGFKTAVLSGTLNLNTVAGVAVFSNLVLTGPVQGQYKIGFRSAGLIQTTFVQLIRIGPPYHLLLDSYTNGVPRSDFLTNINPIVIKALDAGFEFIGTTDNNQTRTVHVQTLNTTATTLAGVLSAPLTNGTATFSGIQFRSPTEGTILLRFYSEAVRIATVIEEFVPVVIKFGPVRNIRVRSGKLQAHPCENTIYMNPIAVETIDAGGNFMPDDQNSPISAILSGYPYNTGTNKSAVTINGVATLTGLTFSSPITSPIPSGLINITFSTFISNQALSTNSLIDVTAGSPSRLKVFGVTGQQPESFDPLTGVLTVKIPYEGAAATGGVRRVNLPRVDIRAYDNCHSYQPNANFVVTLQDNSGALVTNQGIAQPGVVVDENDQVIVVDGETETKKARRIMPRAVANPMTSIAGGAANFDNVYLTPVSGRYEFTVSAPSMKPTTLFVIVEPGPPVAFEFVGPWANPSVPIVHNNVGFGSGRVFLQPIIRIVDDVRNRKNDTLGVNIIGTPKNLVGLQLQQRLDIEGGNNFVIQNGQTQMQTLVIRGAHGVHYDISAVTNDQTKNLQPAVYRNFSISECDSRSTTVEYGANSIPDYEAGVAGQTCVCEPGFTLRRPDINKDEFRCLPCEESRFKDTQGVGACRTCPENMNTRGIVGATTIDLCECKSGFYAKNNNPDKCLQCREGGLCVSGEPIVPLPGFFSFRTGSDNFYACPNPDACIGRNGTCLPGYTGPLCSLCAPGYGRFGVECSVCGEQAGSWVLVILAILAICAMLAFLVKTASVERSKNGTVMKVLLNYLQVIAFVGDLSVRWPPLIIALFSLMRVSLFSLNLHPVDCSMGPDFYDRFTAYMFFPVVAVFGPGTFYFLYYWGRRALSFVMKDVWLYINKNTMMANQNPWIKTKEHWQEFARHCKKRFLLAALIAMFLAHPIITKNGFQMFNCVTYYDGIPGEAGTKSFRYVAEDLSIDCETPEHKEWELIATLVVTLYCGGVPLLAVFILWRNRTELHTRKVQDKYRFLYDGYKTHRFYWEAVIMVRKVLIVSVVVLYREKALSQLYASLWVVFAALIAHLIARPYATHLSSRLEMFALIVTLITLMTGILYYSGEMDQVAEDAMSVFLIAQNAGMGMVFLFVLAQGYYQTQKQKREGDNKRLKINELLAKVGEEDAESLERMAINSGIKVAKRRSTVNMGNSVELKELQNPTIDTYALRAQMRAGAKARKYKKNVAEAEELAIWEAECLKAKRFGLPIPENPVEKRKALEKLEQEKKEKLQQEMATKKAEEEEKKKHRKKKRLDDWDSDAEEEWETDTDEEGSEWETDTDEEGSEWETDTDEEGSEWETDTDEEEEEEEAEK